MKPPAPALPTELANDTLLPLVLIVPPLVLNVVVRPEMSVVLAPAYTRVPPLKVIAVPFPRLLADANTSAPPSTFTGPVNVLVPESVVLPEPNCVNCPPPLMTLGSATAFDRFTANVVPGWVTTSEAVAIEPVVLPDPSCTMPSLMNVRPV